MNESDRQRIFRRNNFTCQYCGLDASLDFHTWYYANLNIDHINPKGGDDDSNLITACRTCNLIKGPIQCANFKEAKELVLRKRKESEEWFKANVLPCARAKKSESS